MNTSLLIWLLNVLLQVSCISALGLAVSRTVRKNAATKYWMLFVALLLILLSPLASALIQRGGQSLVALDLSASDARDLETETTLPSPVSEMPVRAPEKESLEASTDRQTKNQLASDLDTQPVSAAPTTNLGPQRFGLEHDEFSDRATQYGIARGDDLGAVGTQSNLEISRDTKGSWKLVATVLAVMWIVGAIIMVLRLGANWWRLDRLLRRAKPNTNSEVASALSNVAHQLGMRHRPLLVLSEDISGPVSAGILHLRIVLPSDLVSKVSPNHLRDLLVHEAAHILRRDQVVVLLQNFVGAIFWFHPLVKWLNRELAKAREEVCDNYVLATSSGPSYSRTLLALAEIVTPPSIPGAVGLFTSRWKLENRVADLLDERRSCGVKLTARAKLAILALSLVIAAAAGMGTVTLAEGQKTEEAQSTDQAEKEISTTKLAASVGPIQRGEGKDREILVRGRVLSVDGDPAKAFKLTAKVYKSQLGRDILPTKVDDSEFELWVPVGGSHWMYVEVAAESIDGQSRVFHGIGNRALRQAAIEGVELQLAPANRAVEITVVHKGSAVANAHVTAELSDNALLRDKTNSSGKVVFRLSDEEKLRQLTAWTDDFRIGGFSFSRKPRRDPSGNEFSIELDECHDQVFRIVNADDDSPVDNLAFELVIGTGRPNYNFAAVPSTFPHCQMTTNLRGEATQRWFPDWETHGAYVNIVDAGWATAVENEKFEVAEDGALVMPVKRRIYRKPLLGKVTSKETDVGGLLVEIKSFQGEEEGHSDHCYAFTDASGHFQTDCIPGATYTVCVNDRKLASKMVDLVPYELDTGKSNSVELEVREGEPVEIRVTSGPKREPMKNQWVYVRQNHSYTRIENGERKNGTGARDHPVWTDDNGVAYAQALAGSELRVSVNAGEWRSRNHHLTVKNDGTNLVEIHREITDEREVSGRLLAPEGADAELAGAEIVYGSIGGETDEREAVVADSEGRFRIKTKALQLGVFAYTTDGKAAGVAKPENLDGEIALQLQPTMDMHGQLLGKNDEPLADHPVRVKPRVEGKRDFDKTFATSFTAKTFETKTDQAGKYTLKNLPTEFDMTLRSDPIDGSDYDAYLDGFYLVPGDDRPRMVSRLDTAREPEVRSLSQRLDGQLRDAKLGDYHVLVLGFDKTTVDFVNTKLLDRDAIREVVSFLNLRIDESTLSKDEDRKFAESKSWTTGPSAKTVLMCALDKTGKELGRIELDPRDTGAVTRGAEFIRKYAPPRADAKAKWDAAFTEARKSGRRVWARVGQRYCGPCFVLSRWLDDNRAQIERDYVLLKIDNARDENGGEIASRIVSDREHFGVPFHTIFDANEQLLIDSESPVGNIGNARSFEGRRHLAKMLGESRKNLTDRDVQQIVETLEQ